MRYVISLMCLALIFLSGHVRSVNAQGTETERVARDDTRASEMRVPLTEQAIAFDIKGQTALAGRLQTTALAGTPDAPVRNSRIVIESRSASFYNYVSGRATFYDAEGVRCGEGLWTFEVLAPGESVEVDTPGLRLTCAPASWRIVVTNLITRTNSSGGGAAPPLQPPLEININGNTLPLQLGNPLEITIGKERVRIIVSAP